MYPEKVLGVIPNLGSGMLGQHSHTLVVTNYRMIFAEVTKQLLNQESERAVAGVQDEGMMSRWKAQMSSHFNFHNRYYNMPPQSILQESPNNYELKPDQIKSVKIRAGHYDHGSGQQYSNKMVIKSSIGKKKFSFDNMNSNQVKEILGRLLGPKVK